MGVLDRLFKAEAAGAQTEGDRPAGNPVGEVFGAQPAEPEPEAAARRLRHGAATVSRRAQAAAGRREMTRAAQAVLSASDTPATELPSLLKAEAGKALKDRLARARQAGLADEDLARLEAELGAQELVLLERGLAEQAVRLQAQTEAQLEAEAGELVAAVRRDPGQVASADSALAELMADFAPGFRPGALEGFGARARRRLAAAEVEGLLARGEGDAALAALDRAQNLPEAAHRRLRREVATRRRRQSREDQALAEAVRAQLINEVEAGRSADPKRLRQIAVLGGPEALEGLGGELERAAERRRVAERLAALPRHAWPEVLQEEGLEVSGLDPAREVRQSLRDPRLALATQRAQAEGDEGARSPSDREIDAFLSETVDLTEQAFREAAAEFGLDPEIALLLRDMLRATPADETVLKNRIAEIFPFGFGAVRNEFRSVLDQILMTEDKETRRRLLEPQLKFGRADRDLLADAEAGSFPLGTRRPKSKRLGFKDDDDGDRARPESGGGSGAASASLNRLKISRGVVTEARPGRGEGAGRVHIVRKADVATYPEQETRLFIGRERSGRGDAETLLAEDVLRTGRPLGMLRDGVIEAFKTVLREHLPGLPKDARIAIRGSAVTGDGFRRDFFDVGRDSDWDIAIVSPTLLDRARKLGVPLRQGGRRTAVLGEETVEELELLGLLTKVKAFPKRGETAIMIYGSQGALNGRGPNITFDLK